MNFSGKKAFEIANSNQHRSMSEWYKNITTFPHIPHNPKFQIPSEGNFFTIGSCFARNVENSLRASNLALLSDLPNIPGEYFEIGGHARTGYQNVYTPGSIYEAMKLSISESPYHSIHQNNDKYIDLLTSGTIPLSKQDAYGVRDNILNAYRKLKHVDTLIITLGYTESWFYTPDSSYINRAPSNISLRRNIEHFQFASLNYTSCLDLLSASMKLINQIAPRCKVILTVSPVPLGDTFTDQSVVVANQLSKATLRTVASDIANAFSFVDYFPSYEIIVNSSRSETFLEDGMHIKAEPVDNVIEQFKASYFS